MEKVEAIDEPGIRYSVSRMEDQLFEAMIMRQEGQKELRKFQLQVQNSQVRLQKLDDHGLKP